MSEKLEKWQWNLSRSNGSWVINQSNILPDFINNTRTVWCIEMSMPFLSFSDNLLQDAFIIFQNGADNFEIVYKICSILVQGEATPLGFIFLADTSTEKFGIKKTYWVNTMQVFHKNFTISLPCWITYLYSSHSN